MILTAEFAGSKTVTGKIWLRRLGLLVSVLFSIWLVLLALGRFLIVDTGATKADALVVLSGSANYKERTHWAAKVFHNGQTPIVLITNDNLRGGWSSPQQKNPFFFELELDELKTHGIPDDRIRLIKEPVSSTYDEAKAVREFAIATHLRSLIVITSPYHSRRALWTFRQVFAGTNITIDINPARSTVTGSETESWWGSHRKWLELPLEYVKLIYYWLRYRT